MTHYKRRTDNTHAAIRDTLRGAGWTVSDYSAVGQGVPDLRVLKANVGLWIDAKSKGGEVEHAQVKFAALCPESIFVAAISPEFAIQMAQKAWTGRILLRGAWHCEPGVKIED